MAFGKEHAFFEQANAIPDKVEERNIDRVLGILNAEKQALESGLFKALEGMLTSTTPALTDEPEAESFLANELKLLTAEVGKLKKLALSMIANDAEARNEVASKFDYLTAQAKTQDKRQWFFQLFGVIVAVVIAASFAPEQAQKLFAATMQLARNLFSVTLRIP
jgi:hypothetical protein